MDKTFFLHSAIPYVNAAPHIGHAQEFLYTDVIRRFQKLLKKDVFYLCGADENGLKIVQAAEKAGQTPQIFCDIHQQEFLDLAQKLNVPFDVWQRGTNKNHHISSQRLWKLCEKNGDIYKKKYTGLYCIGCETFYTPEEIDDKGECFEHPGKKLDTVSEENYFFALSKYQLFIEDLIQSDQLKITPEIRKNEALAFVRRGLEDFSISRSKKRAKNWGVEVPGDPDQIMYVWFDALNIYQSGIGFGWDEKTYTKWWPPKIMVIGKGILRFHAVYWPAILKSAGRQTPSELFVHGYLTVDGQKMSKTLGNVVDPIQMIEKYGVDAVRYYLLREIPSYGDGDFSETRFKEIYNSDLANNIGNLVSRVARLAQNNALNPNKIKQSKENRVLEKITPMLTKFQFDKSIEYILTRVKELNLYIDSQEPWKQSPEDAIVTLLSILNGTKTLCSLLEIAESLLPFLPETSDKILAQFQSQKMSAQPPLFPRIK